MVEKNGQTISSPEGRFCQITHHLMIRITPSTKADTLLLDYRVTNGYWLFPIQNVDSEHESSMRVSWTAGREESMKKDKKSDELRSEYKREDLGQGIRGKYFESYQEGTNLVLLSPDVAKVFTSEEAVNEALRSLINIAERSIGPKKVSSGHV